MGKKRMNKTSKEFYEGIVALLVLGTFLSGIFVVLKLTGVIAWSYWKIFLPVLIAVGIPVIYFACLTIMLLCIWLLAWLASK